MPDQKPIIVKSSRTSVPRTLIGAAWRTDHTFVATILVKNNLANDSIQFTPVLFMADGTEYDLPAQTAAPTQLVNINVNDALRNAPAEIASHMSEYGSAAIRFTHSGNVITANIQSLDVPRSLIYLDCLAEGVPTMPVQPGHQIVEGLWWKRNAKTGGFVALANTTNHPISALVNTSASSGVGGKPQTLTIASHATEMLDFGKVLTGEARNDLHGGIRIEYDGIIDDLMTVGGMENADEGFSAPMYFRDETKERAAQDYIQASVGIMVGTPDPMMNFPKGTIFTPYAVVRNASGKPLDVNAAIEYTSGGSMQWQELQLSTVHLGVHETRRIDLLGAMRKAGIGEYNGSIHLSFRYSADPNSLIVATGSVDDTGNYVFDVAARGVISTAGRSITYMGDADGSDTMFTVWNPTKAAQDVVMTFFTQAGTYNFPIHVEGRGTEMFNLSEIAMRNVPDSDGHLLPMDASGTAQITSAQGRANRFTLAVSAGKFMCRRRPAAAVAPRAIRTCNPSTCNSLRGG